MLVKLMKYEIKATARIFLPLYGALILLSVISRLFMNFSFTLPSVITTSLWGFMIGAVCVITLVLTLQRFRRNLLGSEGYLMFTLPVKTDSLILSKLFISALWFIASSVVVLIAIAIIAMQGFSLGDFLNGFSSLSEVIRIENYHFVLYALELLLMGLLSLFCGILMLYTCISLSLFASKYRGLWSFGAFIGINILGQSLLSGLISISGEFNLSFFQNLGNLAQVHASFLMIIIASLVVSAVFYLAIRYILKNKLNLE